MQTGTEQSSPISDSLEWSLTEYADIWAELATWDTASDELWEGEEDK